MKQFMGLIVGVVFLFGFQLNAFSGDAIKMGVVDLQKIQQNSSAFKKLSESYMKALELKKKEFEKEQSSLRALEEEMRKQNMMLSLDAKESKMKEYGKKTRRLKYLESELRQEAKEAEMELKRSVLIDIAKVVGDIGKKEGYSLILEKGSSGFLYSNDSIDITDRVVKAYDQANR